MNKTKIIIGASVLIGAAGVAYILVKKSQQSGGAGAANAESSTGTSAPSGSSLPATVTTPPSATSRVSKYPEGTLLRVGSSDPVYIIDAQGYRHWIATRSAFDRMKLSMSNVKSISSAEMESIPRLQNIAGLGILL